jgi:hypothetical protein
MILFAFKFGELPEAWTTSHQVLLSKDNLGARDAPERSTLWYHITVSVRRHQRPNVHQLRPLETNFVRYNPTHASRGNHLRQ